VDDLTGVAQDAETLLEVLADNDRRGWSTQFVARPGAAIECEDCHNHFAAAETRALELRRLEGASDPDDMLAVAAIECPHCGHRGSLVLNYGPTASTEDAAVLLALRDPAS
jgi:hypothetical protein